MSIIPIEILPYYNRFFEEAASRNIFVNRKKCEFVFISNSPFYCGLSDQEDHKIYIDTSSQTYKIHPEALIFHEMSHYFLNSAHRNGHFNNITQDNISIMNIFCSVNYYFPYEYKRQYYIDELFKENTPPAEWCIK